ncbi:lyase family protein [Actinomadura macra]|uniref:lyase family protein n=1 Tax=Actinomadura macra TaxID=46164 RepID=UPI00082BC6BE|nr:lyase family protein [Actinomadura macra]
MSVNEADTGRLRTAASSRIRSMLLEKKTHARPEWKDELARISLVDLAHVVMLTERGVIDADVAASLLAAVVDLRRQSFVPLEGRPTPRGLYLAYEGHLIERLGDGVGGVLHTGRSRNDLNATCFQLALREPFIRLGSELAALGVVLLNRARRYRELPMAAYTHFQGAVPVTFGHYLLGLAAALERDLAALLQAAAALDRCPLGAGAVGGTTVPIDAGRTADLLGFTGRVRNSIDAVASRDAALRLVSAAAVLGVTLDRAALDLLLWSSREYGYVTIPDGLVGSSSMMPQKRNPFVLEHVQGRSAMALGAFVTAAGAMRGTPFTNSIAVGTEAVGPIIPALLATADATEILRLAYAGLRPNPAAMATGAEAALTEATAVAELLALAGTPFRRSHHEVGAGVRAVLEGDAGSLWEAVALGTRFPDKTRAELEPRAIWRAAEFGAGPGPASFDRVFPELVGDWMRHRATLAERRARWSEADLRLAAAVDRLQAAEGAATTKEDADVQS